MTNKIKNKNKMENLFKNITAINNLVYAELTRSITADDFIQIGEPQLTVTAYSNKTKIKIDCLYKIKNSVWKEIDAFFSLAFNRNSDYLKMYGADYIETLVMFNISETQYIDFRGCKTEQVRQKKIDKTKAEVSAFFKQFNILLIDNRIIEINKSLSGFVCLCNKDFSERITAWLIDTYSYKEDFEKSEILCSLQKEELDLKEHINKLMAQKKIIIDAITKRKRAIASTQLDMNNYEISVNDESAKLPNSVIEQVKEAIAKGFECKTQYFF